MTFTDLKPVPALPDPTNKGGVSRWDGGLLFVNTAVDGNCTEGRVNVTLRASFDDGATWSQPGLLVSEPGGYSDVVVSNGSLAAVIYENATCEISIALVDAEA